MKEGILNPVKGWGCKFRLHLETLTLAGYKFRPHLEILTVVDCKSPLRLMTGGEGCKFLQHLVILSAVGYTPLLHLEGRPLGYGCNSTNPPADYQSTLLHS